MFTKVSLPWSISYKSYRKSVKGNNTEMHMEQGQIFKMQNLMLCTNLQQFTAAQSLHVALFLYSSSCFKGVISVVMCKAR